MMSRDGDSSGATTKEADEVRTIEGRSSSSSRNSFRNTNVENYNQVLRAFDSAPSSSFREDEDQAPRMTL